MANTPKMKDPTEAALSAIQDALNVRDAEPSGSHDRPADPRPCRRKSHVGSAPGPACARARRPRPSHSRTTLRRPEDTDTLRRPANDDRESIGQILRTLQRRPARTSYICASVFAVVWVVAGFAPRLGLSAGYPRGRSVPAA